MSRIPCLLQEEIVIRVPLTTAHIGVVRAAASALAARLDLTYNRITDLHIAIDEVCSRIRVTSDPEPTRLEVRFVLEESGLTVRASGDTPAKRDKQFLNPWSEMILARVTDSHDLTEMDGISSIAFRILKGSAR